MQSIGKKGTEIGNHHDNEQMSTRHCGVAVLNDNMLKVWSHKITILTGVRYS